ncbi:endonuclease/exonuclease/phosphatase family protein [Streptomyces spiramyceticus]|uniref:endonuclease/exonuclease/phosphatase family protein n=1 Tax=Streptomyces spiramyceticus TaxID=299717 RepID=UPI00237B5085|nr:endonuclease/exonuclease/phosphatase family protein [Streptomyces spiramyceticus]
MRVLTWNLWWRFGPWEARQKAILAVLREQRADVIGLQEVWARGNDNQAAWLAGELGMHWAWTPYYLPERWQKRIGDSSVDVGLAVLSRWPVVARHSVRLPVAGGRDDGRVAMHARIDSPAGPVPFFTTHLNSAVHDSGMRCAQVRSLVHFVFEHRGNGHFPAVVAGDFNAWPDSDEIRLLGGYRTSPPVPGQSFIDAWEYADPAAPSATWDNTNAYIAGTCQPSVRIDYIHVGWRGPEGQGGVRSAHRAGHGAVDGVWPSDHAAVVADLAD